MDLHKEVRTNAIKVEEGMYKYYKRVLSYFWTLTQGLKKWLSIKMLRDWRKTGCYSVVMSLGKLKITLNYSRKSNI